MAPSTRSTRLAEEGSRSSSLSSPLRTTYEELVQQDESALAALEKRITVVKKQRNELRAL